MTAQLSIGVNLASLGTSPLWWLEAATRLERAGYAGIWCWDHLMGRPGPPTPVVEAWTALSAVAAVTTRAEVGTFVLNVMNRHPALVAAMACTLQTISEGRLILGLGIGGGIAEHRALGIDMPEVPERVARFREAVAVIRALWSGTVVTRDSPYYPLREAIGSGHPEPVPPIVVGGETRAGARLAAEVGDGWTAFTTNFRNLLPAYIETLEQVGKRRESQRVLVGVQGGVFADGTDPDPLKPWCQRPRETLERWREAGADAAILTVASGRDVDRLVAAADRW